MNAPESEKFFFYSLESLRGVAALFVVIYHIYWSNPLYEIDFFRNGALMVDIFFVLSGYVITHTYGSRLHSLTALKLFMWSRFWRIYPLHLFFLFTFLAIESIRYIYQSYYGGMISEPAFSNSNALSFLYHLLLVHSMGLQSEGSFNSPSWSISVEFYTYFIFGLIVVFSKWKKFRDFVFLMTAIISIVIIVYTGHDSLSFDYDYSFFRCLYGFSIGAITYQLTSQFVDLRNNKRFGTKTHPQLSLDFLPLLSTIILLSLLVEKNENWLEFLVPVASAFFIATLVSFPNSLPAQILLLKPLMWAGKISYSIYMSHMAVLWVISVFLQVVFDFSRGIDALGNTVILLNSWQGTIATCVAIGATLFVSHCTYKYVEDPARRWGKIILERRPKSYFLNWLHS